MKPVINNDPEKSQNIQSPDWQIRYSTLQTAPATKKRGLLIIVLLIIVFALGFANMFLVLDYKKSNLDPNRFIEESLTTISGKVVDRDTGFNLEDVIIKIKGTNQSVITNKDGWFTIVDVNTGNIEIQASKSSYKILIKKALVTSTSIQVINFQLEKGSGEKYEDLVGENVEKTRQDTNTNIAIVYGTMAALTVPAIIFVAFRRFFWFTVILIILSMLSMGFFAGTLSGALALITLVSIKDDFKTTRTQVRPIQDRTPKRQDITRRPPLIRQQTHTPAESKDLLKRKDH